MPQFYTLLTDTGQAKLANAVALGGTIEITELAVGDGGGSLPTPDSSATALINEVRRAAINTSIVDPDNPSWIVVEQVLPPDVGGWTIREIGIIDADGDLIGIGNYPETYKPVLAEGSSRTQTVRFVLEVSDTAAVTLKVDPSVVLATREYVDQERAEHEAGRAHPLATPTEKGMVVRATPTEAKAGAADKVPDAAGVLETIQQFGIGLETLSSAEVDLIDPSTPTGMFSYTSGSTNAPDGSTDYGTVLVLNRYDYDGQKTLIATSFQAKKLYFRTIVGKYDFDSGWRAILHDSNMGVGSGIDSEFLAGQAAAFYRNASNLNAGTVPEARLAPATTTAKGAVVKAALSEAKSGVPDKFIDGAGLLAAIHQYGLGVDVPRDVPNGDFNQALEQGFYKTNAVTENWPPGGVDAQIGSLLVMSRTADRKSQLFVDLADRLWLRTLDGSGWSPWKEIVNSANVDGYIDDRLASTMPSTLSVTGSQQLPGGLILQWFSVVVPADSGASGMFEFAFPNAVFGHALGLEYVGDGAAGECTVQVDTLTTTGATLYSNRQEGSSNDDVKVTVLAIGK